MVVEGAQVGGLRLSSRALVTRLVRGRGTRAQRPRWAAGLLLRKLREESCWHFWAPPPLLLLLVAPPPRAEVS